MVGFGDGGDSGGDGGGGGGGGGDVPESKALPNFGLVWAVEIRVIVIVLATSTFFCLNDGFYTM